MNTKGMTIPLMLVLVCVAVSGSWAGGQACDYKGCNWLATGVVTNTRDTGFLMLAKDGHTYWIGTAKADVVSDVAARTGTPVRAGDVVRVFGTIAEADTIRASRVRVMPEETIAGAGAKAQPPQVKIIVEKPEAAAEAACATPVSTVAAKPDWESRGLITEIDPTGGYIRIRTSTGEFTVDVTGAQFISGRRGIGLGQLSLGDSVRVIGYGGCDAKVQAAQVVVTMPKWQADSAVPQLPISVAGMIQTVDFPSQTFTMTMHGQVVQVMADKNTYVQSEKRPAGFSELKPGMRVKMTGYGSPATGYAAQHIQIISVAP
jgi:hypothetical protein